MKTILPSLVLLIFGASAFGGQRSVALGTTCHSSGIVCSRSVRTQSAGTEGAYYHSNLSHNAVILINETSEFMTFFVYSGDICGPNDVNEMIRIGAQVYEIVVPPHQVSYTDERARHYWVCSKPGKWGIDMAANRVVRLPW